MPKIASLDPTLVAAAGLAPNAATNLDDIERAIEEAPALRKRLGIDTVGKLKRIGEGSWARAYRLPDGRVLKLTTDASDAAAAALVASAASRPAGLTPVFEVVMFPWPIRDRKWDPIRGIGGDVKRDLYAIVMAYVPPPKNMADEKLIEALSHAFDLLLNEAGFNGTNPLWELRRRDDDDLTPWLWDLTHGWMWLAERGWVVRDISPTNIGILDGELVIIDMGLSSTANATMPEFQMAANAATGDCYRQAITEARKLDDARVIHGRVSDGGRTIRHAWIEVGKTIVDPTVGVQGDAKHMRRLGLRYVAEAAYDPMDATAMSVQHKHWGPWHETDEERLMPNLNGPAIDNEKGLGAAPNNANIDYLGLRVLMKPSVFLSLALPLDHPRAKTTAFMPGYLRDGGAIAAPTLYFAVPEDWEEGDLSTPAKITNHEGRHRMTAIRSVFGDRPVEVHMLPALYYRRRHFTPAWIARLNESLVPQRSDLGAIQGPFFTLMDDGPLTQNGAMTSVMRCFDECFSVVRERFPDFGTIELHEDEKAGGDNGHGSERQFGYCKAGDPIVIAFAPKTNTLAGAFIKGLMRHEFGHAIDFRYGSKLPKMLDAKLPSGVERRADKIAEVVFGDPIAYGGPHLVQCVSCTGQSPRPKKLGA